MELKIHTETISKIAELSQNLLEMEAKIHAKESSIELDDIAHVKPLSILPLAVYANSQGKKIVYTGSDPEIAMYLRAIGFPKGFSDCNKIKQRCLPIARMKCSLKNPLLDRYVKKIIPNAPEESRTSLLNCLNCLTSELETNVKQHAKVDDYWMLAQYWKATNICEICILDTGIGYRESYRGTPHEVATHKEAIENALRGISSKWEDGRGHGIPGILKMFVEGYKGELIIFTGNMILCHSSDGAVFFKSKFNWQGVMAGIIFNVKPIRSEQYY